VLCCASLIMEKHTSNPRKFLCPTALSYILNMHHLTNTHMHTHILSRRYHVAWSPCLPAVASACSFDRKVQFYSMSGAKSRLGRAPKWLKKPTGATFGFGGKLISFDCGSLDGAAPSEAMKGKGERQRER
jgi:hypothetical protein